MGRRVNPAVHRSTDAPAPGSPAASGSPELIGELTRVVLPCSIRVVDEAKREIEVCATSEAKDSYRTIFGYEASKDAFSRWAGNVREMHDRKAVGRKVSVRTDDAAKKIYTRLRISKGAEDTWQKVLDGTLAGASIGASNVEWQNQRVGDEDIPVAVRYDLIELSLVDLPSNPDAAGVTFVRDGVPDALLLESVEQVENVEGVEGTGEGLAEANQASGSAPSSPPAAPAAPAASVPASLGSASTVSTVSMVIREGAGALTTEDPAALIAQRALDAAHAAIALGGPAALATPPADTITAKRARLASLGAPGYVAPAAPSPSGAPAVTVRAADTAGAMAPGAGYDFDGDHDLPAGAGPVRPEMPEMPIETGPTDGCVMAPSPAGSVAHMAHTHHHTGHYDDPSDHRETSAHMHQDGTSHLHEHVMDHAHGHHEGLVGGHAHTHVHVPDHGHSYRVADGAPLDARLVSAEAARRFACVSEAAFRAAGGFEGRPLTAEQFRVAASHELAELTLLQERALGPYSRNPDGPADAGTPAQVSATPTTALTGEGALGEGNEGSPALDAALDGALDAADGSAGVAREGQAPLAQGQVQALDRDGQPIAGADANGATGQGPSDTSSSGTSDVAQPADGWTGRGMVASVASVAEVERVVSSSVASSVERILTAVEQRFTSGIQQLESKLEARLARIESTPQSGGPVLRMADKGSPLVANGGNPSTGDRLRALESLAGTLRDPQAQVAVAAEMIRLQQEAAGIAPAMQVMPRAGRMWSE